MFPWLAYGHISPYLELAKRLTDRGFAIYICSTPINLGFIKKRITGKYSVTIKLVELHLPDTPELPPHYHTTNGLPPHLMATLKRALNGAKPELSNILKTLKPDFVIYDATQTWTAALTVAHNIPAVKFLTSSVSMLAYFCHLFMKPGIEFPFPAIYLSDFEQAKARTAAQDARADAEENDPAAERPNRDCDSIFLVKSSRAIEGKYIDYLFDLMKLKMLPVGMLVEEPVKDDQGDNSNELIQWLGTKSQRSTVLVSFGTEYFLTKEEMEEIAHGLELSEVNFIWVVRFAMGQKIRPDEALPEGFLERVGDRGRIVEGWAPQSEVLAHPSTGGFICHCGWNSVVESIEFGVPVIAMPMHLDQPLNARLVVEIGAGMEVVRDETGKFDRKEIARAIKDAMVEKTGENTRAKMLDVKGRVELKEKQELDEVAELLTQLVTETTQSSN
uniref:Beta-D-glucosyl crocetin beta-1,6-glucosyltransferase n=1 Tax=Gardenia jasminoides TaxID=114476 RepID=UGT9_GARJA|nr:RecName: Full=Beta-D-glucosyl crocetin beta-1,6-glucosyltransferase; AltName: Full=UDP-glucose glucosyltransferase 9; Short=GjUGT9; AltName: Full=UDP-glycosyltransferase 94E5 [Gardenia jasminoides]BAK55744.1 UDP-glucose glucosyltransferase [Gardenia jasminoides]